MAKIITRADETAFVNKLANAILDRQELKATDKGSVSMTGKKVENYTDKDAVEVGAHIVNTLLAMRDGKDAGKIKKLDQFLVKYQDEVTSFQIALKGPSPTISEDEYAYALDQALKNLLLLPHYVMQFENNDAVETAMEMNFGVMASYSDKPMPLEGINHIEAFQEALVRNHDKFIGPKEVLILPTMAWKDTPKKERTQEFRTIQFDAVQRDIQQFLAEQSELRAIQALAEAEAANQTPTAPEEAASVIPPPIGFEGIEREVAREQKAKVVSSTVTSVPPKKSRVPDDEEVLPTLPELPRAKLVKKEATPKTLDFPAVSWVLDEDYPTLKS